MSLASMEDNAVHVDIGQAFCPLDMFSLNKAAKTGRSWPQLGESTFGVRTRGPANTDGVSNQRRHNCDTNRIPLVIEDAAPPPLLS